MIGAWGLKHPIWKLETQRFLDFYALCYYYSFINYSLSK